MNRQVTQKFFYFCVTWRFKSLLLLDFVEGSVVERRAGIANAEHERNAGDAFGNGGRDHQGLPAFGSGGSGDNQRFVARKPAGFSAQTQRERDAAGIEFVVEFDPHLTEVFLTGGDVGVLQDHCIVS